MKEYRYTYTNLSNGESVQPTIAPADYDQLDRNYDRSATYHGIARMYTGSQRIVDVDGQAFDSSKYWFIRNIWETEGIKGQIEFKRDKYNPFTNEYDNDLVAIVNFTPDAGFYIDITEGFVEFTLIDNSKLQKFFANDEKNVDILSLEAIDGTTVPDFANSPKEIEFTPINIYLQGQTSGNFGSNPIGVSPSGEGDLLYKKTITTAWMGDRLIESNTTPKIYENTTDETIEVRLDVQFSYNGKITYTSTGKPDLILGEIEWKAILKNSGGGVEQEFIYASEDVDGIDTGETTFSGSVNNQDTVDVEAGWYLDFAIYYDFELENMDALLTPGTTVNNFDIIEYYPSIDTSAVDCYMTHEIAQRLIQLCTGETDTSKLLESNIFGRTDSEFQTYATNGALSNLATTSTKKLRNFPGATITLSFRDWFKSIDRMGNIAMWFDKANDRFRIEEKEQVYKDEQVLDLGTVANLKIRPYKDGYWSQLMTGTSSKGDYEKVQGAQEYNVQSEHSIDLPLKDKLDLRVPYNTDSLTMEFSRVERYESTGSTDTKEDNKICIVAVDYAALETKVNGSGYGGFVGIDERYNGDYTPLKCLYNNSNWLSGIFEHDENTDEVILFQNNVKDIDITYPGIWKPAITSEQENLRKTDLKTPLFFPVSYECDFIIDYEGIEAIENNRHGYFKFNDESGTVYYGYGLTLQVNDSTQKGSGTFVKANINRS